MIVELRKNVNNVDFGIQGIKNLSVDVRFEFQKNEWQVYLCSIHLVHGDGKLTPIDKSLLSRE